MSSKRNTRNFTFKQNYVPKQRKNKKVDKKEKYKNTKGFYPYPWNNLIGDTTSLDMVKLSPESITINKLDDMRDGYINEIARLEILYTEYKENFKGSNFDKFINTKIKKSDLMKLNNHFKNKEDLLKKELDGLKEKGLTYNPETDYGRLIKMLEYLKKIHMEDKPLISLGIYMRLIEDRFKELLNNNIDLQNKYERHLQWMKQHIEKNDMIKYQLVTKHEILPPLNQKGFTKLDDWQKIAVDKMRNKESTILSVPTSGGKTYLSAYLTKDMGKLLFLAPSIPLARQVAAYLSRVTNSYIPYLTDTYRPHIYHKDMIECLKKNRIVVSTPDIYLDYLPELNSLKETDNLIIDEIHMMGSSQGDSMETIAILNKKAMLLGLSATMSNPNDLIKWREKMNEKLSIVESHKRFFNLQTAFWDNQNKIIQDINPLALLTLEDFVSGKVLSIDLKPTAPDIYNLATNLEKEFGNEFKIKLENIFDKARNVRINLNECLDYFKELIKFMVKKSKFKTKVNKIKKIINQFVPFNLEEENTVLLEIIYHLKETNNIPTLIFERNTYSLMRIAKELIEKINLVEQKQFPNKEKDILKKEKEAKKRKKDMEKSGLILDKDKTISKSSENKVAKLQNKSGMEEIFVEHIQKPTDKFNWCPKKNISDLEMEIIENSLRKYFPRDGDYYHPIIQALWRGIGIYAEGLPDDYLVMVQVMANEKKLGIILSDKSMTFGVSMPFRNVVIYRDLDTEDDLNPLLFKQMEGRAGRRGQDSKGSVIFAGYSWNRIKDLVISEIPTVRGQKSVSNLFLPIGKRLSKLVNNDINFDDVYKNNLYNIQNVHNLDNELIEHNNFWCKWYQDEQLNNIEILRMLWYSRKYDYDGIIFSFIVDELEKHFCDGNISELKQIEMAHILSFMIRNYKSKIENKIILEKPSSYEKFINIRNEIIFKGIELENENNIDGRVFYSIQKNNLYEGKDDKEYQEIRTKFLEFTSILRIIQNYCYYSKRVTITRILGKLFTRCKWILWTSSPLSNFGKDIIYTK